SRSRCARPDPTSRPISRGAPHGPDRIRRTADLRDHPVLRVQLSAAPRLRRRDPRDRRPARPQRRAGRLRPRQGIPARLRGDPRRRLHHPTHPRGPHHAGLDGAGPIPPRPLPRGRPQGRGRPGHQQAHGHGTRPGHRAVPRDRPAHPLPQRSHRHPGRNPGMSYTQRLSEREPAPGRPVRVGLAAAGRTDVERATGIEHASGVIASGRAAVLDDGMRLAELPLDIVVEVSGIPDVAAQVALSCVLAGTDVALMTVEADVTVGLLLARTARAGSAVYTVCRGGEPVECLKLVEYAQDLGLEVVVAGKGKNNPMRPADVPEDVVEEAERKGMNPKMLTSFTDGTKTQIEMAALANATGYSIETPGMHGAAVDLDGLAATLRPAAEGGIITTDRSEERRVGKEGRRRVMHKRE